MLDSRPVSLADAARQAVTAAIPAAQAKGVNDHRRPFPRRTLPVLGDPMRLRQIAWHLLANAIKFTPRGGERRADARRVRRVARLTVFDSGPGIDPAFLPRIFERFTQEDPSPTGPSGGLGVGLSLVHDLVELHGGEIRAGNRDAGQRRGVHDPAAAAPREHRSPQATRVAHLRSALAVATARRRPRARARPGCRRPRAAAHGAAAARGDRRTAASVADALEVLEAWRPDVLVSDSATPEHDSYALVGKVQSLEPSRGGRIPAAALTAFWRTDARVRQMLQTSQRDLPKPVEPAVLTAEIARLTGRERRRAQRIDAALRVRSNEVRRCQ